MTPAARMFQVATVANDAAQYAAMRRSFEAAGFSDDRARYTLFDNARDNRHEPYAVLRQLSGEGPEPYLVLCHQDVRLDLSHGYDQLAAQVALLNDRHPDWAVAGNAGGGCEDRVLAHLDEPTGRYREANLPAAARSLDENFLLLRRSGGALCSEGLRGFHLYGTDVCLHAIARGRTAFVIDFLLTHLSAGNADSPAFRDARARLIAHWNRYFLAGFVKTACTDFCLARNAFVRGLLGKRPIRALYFSWLGNPLIEHPLCPP